MKISLHDKLPDNVKGPFKFREPGSLPEGNLAHPLEIVDLFEPIDVLNGAIEIIDSNYNVIKIVTENMSYIDSNLYPDKSEMSYEIQTNDQN